MFSKGLIYTSKQLYAPETNSSESVYSGPSKSAVLSYSSEPVYPLSTYTSEPINLSKATYVSEPINTTGPIYSSHSVLSSAQTFLEIPPQPTIAVAPIYSSVQVLPAPNFSSVKIYSATSAYTSEQPYSGEPVFTGNIFSVPNLQTQNTPNISTAVVASLKQKISEDLIEPSDLGITSEPDFSQEPILPSDIVISLEEAISAMCSESDISARTDSTQAGPSNVGIFSKPPDSNEFSQEPILSSDMVISLEDAISAICSEPEFPDSSALISNKKDIQKPTLKNTQANLNSKKKKRKNRTSSIVFSPQNKVVRTNVETSDPKSNALKPGSSSNVVMSIEDAMAAMFARTNTALLPTSSQSPELSSDTVDATNLTSSSVLPVDNLISADTGIMPKTAITPTATLSQLPVTSAEVVMSLAASVSIIGLEDAFSHSDTSSKSNPARHSGPPPILKLGTQGQEIITLASRRFAKQKRIPGNKIRWFCSTHAFSGCKAYLHTLDNTIVKCFNKHNHKK